jgi:hypothetical protein
MIAETHTGKEERLLKAAFFHTFANAQEHP